MSSCSPNGRPVAIGARTAADQNRPARLMDRRSATKPSMRPRPVQGRLSRIDGEKWHRHNGRQVRHSHSGLIGPARARQAPDRRCRQRLPLPIGRQHSIVRWVACHLSRQRSQLGTRHRHRIERAATESSSHPLGPLIPQAAHSHQGSVSGVEFRCRPQRKRRAEWKWSQCGSTRSRRKNQGEFQ
jgi:hypothetical protein